MTSHHCPDGYTPIRHKNTKGFLLNNIRHPSTGAYSIDEATAKQTCDETDACDGLLKTNTGYIMRREMSTNTTFKHDQNAPYKWCVHDLMIESKDDNSIKTVPTRVGSFSFGRGVQTVMNGEVCDTNTTEWKDGECVSTVRPEDACQGSDLVYDAERKTCVPTADICDDATMTFQGGRCVSTVDITEDNASVCGRGTKYNEETQQCEKDGGCAIM